MPRLGCSDMIIAHYNLELQESSDPLASASGIARTAGAHHHTQIIFCCCLPEWAGGWGQSRYAAQAGLIWSSHLSLLLIYNLNICLSLFSRLY